MLDSLDVEWVATAEGLLDVAASCRSTGRFALDSEADSLHSYFHKVCLIQVSAGGQHWIVDPLSLEVDDLAPLWDVVAEATTTVVMHGADYDIRVFDRDFEARVRGLEDTQIMAQLLGEPKTGLDSLLGKEFGVQQDKRHQLADWGRRPLPAELVSYAATDTAHLTRLADRLRARLERLGRWSWALEEFHNLEEVRYEPPHQDPLAFERIKGGKALRGAVRDRLFELHEWREEEARRCDLPPFKILGNRPLVELASRPPPDLKDMARIRGLGPRFVRRWGTQVERCLRRPRHAPPRAAKPRAPRFTAQDRRRMQRLIEARDTVAGGLGLPPGLVAPRALIQGLVGGGATASSLADRGLVGWRHRLLARPFLEILGEA